MIKENYYFLDVVFFGKMKDGVMIINISCGELLDLVVVIEVFK